MSSQDFRQPGLGAAPQRHRRPLRLSHAGGWGRAAAWLAVALSGAWPVRSQVVFQAELTSYELRPRRIAATVASPGPPGAALLILSGARPLAWAYPADVAQSATEYRHTGPIAVPDSRPRLSAWFVPADLTARLMDQWPRDLTVAAEVDSFGPGGRSAWVRAGSNDGVAVGDTWWLRIGGQPVARFETRVVDAALSFCTVVPLVSGPPLRPGARVTLWPSPGAARLGMAVTAVVYIEPGTSDPLVWVAAPPAVPTPPEPHLDFFRDGRFVAHGIVEHQDSRFWYVRLVRAGAESAASPSSGAAEAAGGGALSGPGAAPADPVARASAATPARDSLPVRVGDDARVRTQTDVDTLRFIARVFEVTSGGALINAGETAGITVDRLATAYRGGTVLGMVRVTRVQRTYSVVTLEAPAAAYAEAAQGAPTLQVGDYLRFVPPPPPPVPVATLSAVIGSDLFTASVTAPSVPLHTPLLVQSDGRTVGLAIAVVREGEQVGGFVVRASLATPLAAGLVLARPGESEPAPR